MALTPTSLKYKEMMDELLVVVKKNTVLVTIALIFIVLDMRYLHLSHHGGVTGLRHRVGLSMFTFEHVWQEFLYEKQCAIIDFLMGTMCMSLQTVVCGICYTSAFTSPVPNAYAVFKLLLSCTLYAVLQWNGYFTYYWLFALFFAWMYHDEKKLTVGKVVLPVCLQLILCNDILQQDCHTLVRYIVLYFFVCRVLEIIPIVVGYWRIGMCLKKMTVDICSDTFLRLADMYTGVVALVEWSVKCYQKAKAMYQGLAGVVSSSDVGMINYPCGNDILDIHVKTENLDNDNTPVMMKLVNTGRVGPRTRGMYKKGYSPHRPVQ